VWSKSFFWAKITVYDRKLGVFQNPLARVDTESGRQPVAALSIAM